MFLGCNQISISFWQILVHYVRKTILVWVGEDVMHTIFQNLFTGFHLNVSDAFIHSASTIVAFSVITVMHIVFGELAPKSLAIRHPLKTTFAIALPLRIFYFIFRPFIIVLNGLANFLLKIVNRGVSTSKLLFLLANVL